MDLSTMFDGSTCLWHPRSNQTPSFYTIVDKLPAAEGEPTITIDNIEVAQFIYLIMNNKNIRDIIDTITLKVVLILGRFTPERKVALDALRDELRKHDYTPVLFDFDKPSSRNITETVRTFAHLSRFILADITDPTAANRKIEPDDTIGA